MTDSLDELIRGMYERALEWERKQQERVRNSKLNALITLGLRENEAKGWLENEPDFTNRIFTPIRTNREGDATLNRALSSCRRFDQENANFGRCQKPSVRRIKILYCQKSSGTLGKKSSGFHGSLQARNMLFALGLGWDLV